MKPIFISLSPNAKREDVLFSLKLIFTPSRWQKGGEIKKLEESFKKYFQTKYAISFISGRTAFWAILKSLGIKEGDEVLLQAYTCVVVPNSITSLGVKPVWVDIDEETFNMDVKDLEKKISKKSKATIVQHTFGQAAEIEKIKKIARKHKLFVIEDCAQALGGEYQGKKLGTFGDVAFFSFGRDKIISSVFGGMVITNNKKIGKRLKELQVNLPFPPKNWIFQQLLHTPVFSIIIPTYNIFSIGKFLHFLLQKINLLSKAVVKKEKQGQMPKVLFSRMPNALAALALKQFKKMETFNKQRIKIARFYARELKGLPIKLPKTKKDFRHVFLRYTIKTEKAEELTRFAQKRKIFLGDWYRPVIAPKGVNFKKVYYELGSCLKAEKASAMSVNLPTYPKMTMDDAKKVIKVMKEFSNEKLQKGFYLE